MRARFQAAGAAVEVTDGAGLGGAVLALLDDPERARRMGEAGREIVEANRGATRRTAEGSLIGVTVTSTRDGADPVALARKRVADAVAAGYEALLAPHAAWWAKFWSQSHVCVPEPGIQRHYNLVQYFYGAASRRGAPPMPLQGVWTADAG